MKPGRLITVVGVAMFVTGLVLFYSTEIGQTDPVLRLAKNVGTFVGISGMGVTLAGILLHIIDKNEPTTSKRIDV